MKNEENKHAVQSDFTARFDGNRDRILQTSLRFGISIFVSIIASLGCSNDESSNKATGLVVFSAASTNEVAIEAAARFLETSGIDITVSTGPSGVLASQIISGAPCDLLLSANVETAEHVMKDKPNLKQPIVELASNQLVWICPVANAAEDVDRLLSKVKRISIANPDHAPAGRYARESLTNLKMWETLKDKLVFANDVRLASSYVAKGNAELGIVYETEALAFPDDLAIIATFPPETHKPIRYVGLVTSEGERAEDARQFLEFLKSRDCSDIWQRFGFSLIKLEREDSN